MLKAFAIWLFIAAALAGLWFLWPWIEATFSFQQRLITAAFVAFMILIWLLVSISEKIDNLQHEVAKLPKSPEDDRTYEQQVNDEFWDQMSGRK